MTQAKSNRYREKLRAMATEDLQSLHKFFADDCFRGSFRALIDELAAELTERRAATPTGPADVEAALRATEAVPYESAWCDTCDHAWYCCTCEAK